MLLSWSVVCSRNLEIEDAAAKIAKGAKSFSELAPR